MSQEIHLQVAETLAQAQRLTSALNGHLDRMNAETFTATDESGTVEVNLDGHLWLTGVHIEGGLLRLGAETVQQRLNEALHHALTAATLATETAHEQLFGMLGEIADEIGHPLDEHHHGAGSAEGRWVADGHGQADR